MKTAEEILKENGITRQSYEYDYQYEDTIKMMKAYAEQAVDEAAKQAKTKIERIDARAYPTVVDRASILKVKELLK